jgi:hypothetical protein
LAREEAVHGFTMDAQDAPDAHGVEPSVVDQPPNRLGMNAELVRDFTDTHEIFRVSVYGGHNPSEALQVSIARAWARGTLSTDERTY